MAFSDAHTQIAQHEPQPIEQVVRKLKDPILGYIYILLSKLLTTPTQLTAESVAHFCGVTRNTAAKKLALLVEHKLINKYELTSGYRVSVIYSMPPSNNDTQNPVPVHNNCAPRAQILGTRYIDIDRDAYQDIESIYKSWEPHFGELNIPTMHTLKSIEIDPATAKEVMARCVGKANSWGYVISALRRHKQKEHHTEQQGATYLQELKHMNALQGDPTPQPCPPADSAALDAWQAANWEYARQISSRSDQPLSQYFEVLSATADSLTVRATPQTHHKLIKHAQNLMSQRQITLEVKPHAQVSVQS